MTDPAIGPDGVQPIPLNTFCSACGRAMTPISPGYTMGDGAALHFSCPERSIEESTFLIQWSEVHGATPIEARTALAEMDRKVTKIEAWSKCPTSDRCRASGMEHPCLACWDEAGDIVAGLRLEELDRG